VSIDVAIIGSTTKELEELLQSGAVRVTSAPVTELLRLAQPGSKPPRILVVDIRQKAELPASIGLIRREHPSVGIVIVAPKADPTLMLAAMRAGVTEWLVEPFAQKDLRAAVERVAGTAPAPRVGEVFAVVGAKGGVGTTTLAVNFATTLSSVSKGNTLLIDLHPNGGDAALFLGATPNFTLADALENTHRLDQAFLKGLVVKAQNGLDLLASPDRIVAAAPADSRRVRAVVEFAAQTYRFVVLDMPRTDAAVDEAFALASSITVVATQELAAIRSAARLAGALRQRFGSDRVRIVINRYDRAAEIDQDDLERAVGSRIGHKFPSNYRLAIDALNKGRPLVIDNHNKLASSFAAYAKSLSGTTAEAATEDRSSGLLSRLTGRR
jgi:pilus assembly protein CpaE